MALADYFDKAALAGYQVLGGLDFGALATVLDAESVAVAFDVTGTRAEGRVSVDLSLNLLARLYPRLVLEPLDAAAGEIVAELRSAAQQVNPNVEWATSASVTRRLVVGSTAASGNAVYVGSQGWTAQVQRTAPAGSADSGNPFGAAAAACIGAGVVFRDVFANAFPSDEADSLVWSLIDEAPSWRAGDVGEVYLAGVGAIGNAAIWTLARATGMTGTVRLVDPESIELSNVQRYVLARRNDVGRPKVEVALEALRASTLNGVAHRAHWAEVVQELGYAVETAAVALDSDVARCEVQASLPRRVINSWTQPDDLGISRHSFIGPDACLMCLYLPAGPRPDEDDLVAQAIGMPDALMEVRMLLDSGGAVGRPFLERIAVAKGVSVEPLLAFEQRPLRAFYTEGVCGGLLLRLGADGPSERSVATPVAHQSALVGVLLAADVVADRLSLRPTLPNVITRYDVRRPFTAPFSSPAAKDTSGRCICQDSDYVSAYRAKWRSECGLAR